MSALMATTIEINNLQRLDRGTKSSGEDRREVCRCGRGEGCHHRDGHATILRRAEPLMELGVARAGTDCRWHNAGGGTRLGLTIRVDDRRYTQTGRRWREHREREKQKREWCWRYPEDRVGFLHSAVPKETTIKGHGCSRSSRSTKSPILLLPV